MRSLLAVLMAMSFPWFAYAQETNPIQLSDYVSFCVSLWTDSPDIETKATALKLQNAFAAGSDITIGKPKLRYFKSVQDKEIVGMVTTTFSDGKESSCEVTNPRLRVERSDLELMERVLHLDGQILQLGTATVGYWKMQDQDSPVLLKAVVSNRVVTLNVLRFDAAVDRAK